MTLDTLDAQQAHDRQVYAPMQAWWSTSATATQRRPVRRLIAELRILLYKGRQGPEWIDTRYDVPRLMRGDHIIGTVGE